MTAALAIGRILLKERAERERPGRARAPSLSSNCLALSRSLAHINTHQLRTDTMVKDRKTEVSHEAFGYFFPELLLGVVLKKKKLHCLIFSEKRSVHSADMKNTFNKLN